MFFRSLATLALAALAVVASPAPGRAAERVLHAFGLGDGAKPAAPLIADASGALYGTTVAGGGSAACPGGCGTVFKLTPSPHGYVESVLHDFAGGNDGAAAYGGLLEDASGTLYGTTAAGGGNGCGGAGCGTVYKLSPAKSGYTETILYSFQGGIDGAVPRFGSLIADNAGALYGTTQFGGGQGCHGYGCGIVFKLSPHRAGYAQSVLYRFQGGSDGASPLYGLIADARGTLFGTTFAGGDFGCTRGAGCGTIFALTPLHNSYAEGVLYRFNGGTDGAGPNALTGDAAGALYGTTAARGPGRNGTVFKLTPLHNGFTLTTLFAFAEGGTGSAPAGHVLLDGTGAIFGTTLGGGNYGNGTVYKLTPARNGYRETVLYDFKAGNADGGWPQAGLLADAKGRFFGTVSAGGSDVCGGLGCGAAFELR